MKRMLLSSARSGPDKQMPGKVLGSELLVVRLVRWFLLHRPGWSSDWLMGGGPSDSARARLSPDIPMSQRSPQSWH